MKELKPIPGFDGYFANADGRIFSSKRGRYMRPSTNSSGYKVSILNRKQVLVHRMIALAFIGCPPSGHQCDHINRIRTDNRLCNLRYVTVSENRMNRRKGPTRNGIPTTSQYKGVHYSHKHDAWVSRIGIEKKTRVIGSFENEIDAALAYDAIANKVYGNVATTNKSLNICH